MVRRVEHNWGNRIRDGRLFEIGTAFRWKAGGTTGEAGTLKDSLTVEGKGLPDERTCVAAVLTGARHPPHWRGGGEGAHFAFTGPQPHPPYYEAAGGPPRPPP